MSRRSLRCPAQPHGRWKPLHKLGSTLRVPAGRSPGFSWLFALLLVALTCRPAAAQNTGFQLNRYEPTTVGEWSFMVDHPWYSSTRFLALGMTVNYGHNSLVQGRLSSKGSFSTLEAIVMHQLLGHIDVAGSFLDRVNLSFSLPVTFLERGQPLAGVTPLAGAAVGDPRFAGQVRLYGHSDKTPFSVHFGATVWVPLRRFNDSIAPQVSEQTLRFSPKVILGGFHRKFRWSFTGAFVYRAEALLGQTVTIGPEVQLGLSGSYADLFHRFAIGPEVLLSTVVSGGNAFARDYTSLETLLGAHYNFAHQVQVGAAVGLGILREPGTPDVRFLFRLAYAPIRRPPAPDFDKDGVPDKDDACPQEKGVPDPDIRRNGCPLAADQDNDGIADAKDLCPQEPRGVHPDPKRLGCPLGDQDRDGIFDNEDVCPQEAKGDKPDPARKGCPLPDRDRDGVLDSEDQCPGEPAGDKPDPKRRGCPTEQAPRDEAAEEAFLKSLQPIFFAKRSAKLDAGNEATLNALADQLRKNPSRKKLLIRGHSDKEGSTADIERLSRERADAVKNWLVANGIAAERLQTQGMGRTLPMLPPEGEEGTVSRRIAAARNRRADFRPVDPVLSDTELKRLEEQERSALQEPEQPKATGPRPKKSRLDQLLDQVERDQGTEGDRPPPPASP